MVKRRLLAPQLRLINDVVMDQRRGVNQLHGRSGINERIAAWSVAAPARHQDERGAQPFAARGDQVRHAPRERLRETREQAVRDCAQVLLNRRQRFL